MDKLRKSWQCAVYTFLVNNLRPVMFAALFFMCVTLGDELSGLRSYAAAHGETINVWGVFSGMYSNAWMVAVLGLLILLAMGNAPFLDGSQQSIIIRAGQPCWLLGQMIYMVLTTAAMLLLTLIFSALYLFPHISLSFTDWGRVLNTLATLNVSTGCRFYFSTIVVDNLSPVAAFLVTFGLRLAVYLSCAYLMFLINLFSKSRPGIIPAISIPLLGCIANYTFSVHAYWLAPSYLAQLNVFLRWNLPYYPDIWPILGILLGMLVLPAAGIICLGRRADVGKMSA